MFVSKKYSNIEKSKQIKPTNPAPQLAKVLIGEIENRDRPDLDGRIYRF